MDRRDWVLAGGGDAVMVVLVWLVGRFANRPYGLDGWRGLGVVVVVARPRSAPGPHPPSGRGDDRSG